MKIQIRPGAPEDDEAVGELLVRAFMVQYAKKMPGHVVSEKRNADLRNQAEKRKNSTVLVAALNDRVIGTVAVYRFGAPRSQAWIEGAADLRLLGVDVDYLGKGISNMLLDEAERLTRAWNAPAVCLHIRRGCVGLARLYESRGYERDRSGDLDMLPEVFLEAYSLRWRQGQ